MADWAELKNDRLKVRYDPQTVTPQQILQAIAKVGFPGKIMPDGPGAGTP